MMYLAPLLAFCGAAVAGAAEPILLTYEAAAQIAMSDNVDLAALRQSQRSLEHRAAQSLSPSEPTASFSKNNMSKGSLGAAPASRTYSFAMTLGFPGKAFAQSAATRDQAKAVREQASAKELEILSSLGANYAALAANRKLRGLLEDESRKADDMVKLVEQKYSLAQAAQVDLLNAKVIAANFHHQSLVADGSRQLLLIQFLNLIRRPGDKTLMPLIPDEIKLPVLGYDVDRLTEYMLSHRQALKAARYQVDSANASLWQARLSPFPDFQILGARTDYRLANAQPDPQLSRDYTLGIGLNIPIFLPFNELRAMHSASADLAAARAQQESARLNAISDLQTLFNDYERSVRERESLTSLILPMARENYDLLLRNYTFGKADYLKLNEARQNWLQARQDLLQKDLEAARLFYLLVQQVGCDVSRKDGPYACN